MADVSAAMGHSAIGVTDRIYAGVYPEDVADVASVMDKVLPPGSTAGQASRLPGRHRLRIAHRLPASITSYSGVTMTLRRSGQVCCHH
jgi:hypothetical protein